MNQNLEILSYIDEFDSLVWSEKYNDIGSVELVTKVGYRKYFEIDYFLSIPDSDAIMVIDSIEVVDDEEDISTIRISGSSGESLLRRRVIEQIYTSEKKLQDGIRDIVYDNILYPKNSKRKFPNFDFAINSRLKNNDVVQWDILGEDVYSIVKEYCDICNVGFRVDFENHRSLVFRLYNGIDRSRNQSENNLVLFSPKMDNLLNGSHYKSLEDYKNSCYIYGEVTGEGDPRVITFEVGEASGFERREAYFNVSVEATYEYNMEYLVYQEGIKGMLDFQKNDLFEYETTTSEEQKPNVDYFIGDIVQVEDSAGDSSYSRVIEIAITEDEDGLSIIPTFESLE